MSHHLTGLAEWIAEALQCAPSHIEIELIAGDASPRRYYRVTLIRRISEMTWGGGANAILHRDGVASFGEQ